MRFRLLLLLSLTVFALSPVFGKSADDYFHGGAYKYVAGKIQDALVEVEEGLRQYPDDPRLNKLAGQLRKLNDQQKNPPGGQGENKDSKDKQKNDPNSKDPGQDKKNDDGKKPEDKPDGKQPPQPPEPKEGDGKDGKDGKNPGAPPPGQMSEEDAKRLLNSFADDEKKEQRERQKLLRKRMETEQDW